jgi:hypothetical protein
VRRNERGDGPLGSILLQHPALTQESCDELRYQWDLVMSN